MNVDEDEVVDIDIEMSDQKRAEENVHGSKLGTPESKNVNRDDDSACLIHSSMWDPDGLLDPERACTARPSYCTGCSTFRIVMAPMCALVFFLAGITWVAYVFQTPGVTWIELFIFHVLLILVLSSYVQCMLLDPGTVPPGWHSTIAASPHRERFKICKKCHMYKPPRSHYDSITQRLVLNMDHFCPWMVNCIGFYNRKFFVLFFVLDHCCMPIFLLSSAFKVTI